MIYPQNTYIIRLLSDLSSSKRSVSVRFWWSLNREYPCLRFSISFFLGTSKPLITSLLGSYLDSKKYDIVKSKRI